MSVLEYVRDRENVSKWFSDYDKFLVYFRNVIYKIFGQDKPARLSAKEYKEQMQFWKSEKILQNVLNTINNIEKTDPNISFEAMLKRFDEIIKTIISSAVGAEQFIVLPTIFGISLRKTTKKIMPMYNIDEVSNRIRRWIQSLNTLRNNTEIYILNMIRKKFGVPYMSRKQLIDTQLWREISIYKGFLGANISLIKKTLHTMEVEHYTSAQFTNGDTAINNISTGKSYSVFDISIGMGKWKTYEIQDLVEYAESDEVQRYIGNNVLIHHAERISPIYLHNMLKKIYGIAGAIPIAHYNVYEDIAKRGSYQPLVDFLATRSYMNDTSVTLNQPSSALEMSVANYTKNTHSYFLPHQTVDTNYMYPESTISHGNYVTETGNRKTLKAYIDAQDITGVKKWLHCNRLHTGKWDTYVNYSMGSIMPTKMRTTCVDELIQAYARKHKLRYIVEQHKPKSSSYTKNDTHEMSKCERNIYQILEWAFRHNRFDIMDTIIDKITPSLLRKMFIHIIESTSTFKQQWIQLILNHVNLFTIYPNLTYHAYIQKNKHLINYT